MSPNKGAGRVAIARVSRNHRGLVRDLAGGECLRVVEAGARRRAEIVAHDFRWRARRWFDGVR